MYLTNTFFVSTCVLSVACGIVSFAMVSVPCVCVMSCLETHAVSNSIAKENTIILAKIFFHNNALFLIIITYLYCLIQLITIRTFNHILITSTLFYSFNTITKGDIMNFCQLTASITAIANAISNNLSIEEITLLATVLVQLGDTLATIATHKAICEPKDDKCKN